jgi:hypothetical protein
MSRFHPQFRLSTLLWITLSVACFFGGISLERWRWLHYPPGVNVDGPTRRRIDIDLRALNEWP